jgi:hypothetical protein
MRENMPGRIPLPTAAEEAVFLVSEADRAGVLLRILGGTGVYVHCTNFRPLLKALGREPGDIDLVSYFKFNKTGKVEALLQDMGYVGRDRFNALHGRTRLIFDDPSNNTHLEVFFDELKMCHTVKFAGRLELDRPTITLADLFLSKMQIAQLTEKDIKDVFVMFREHDVDNSDKECINEEYIAKELGVDWGFWFTVTTNLGKVRDSVGQYQTLPEEDKRDVLKKLDTLKQRIDAEPKKMKWTMRARIGANANWYQPVDEARQ